MMASSPQPALLIKLRPTGPWRIGPDSGARDRVDRVYHSDSLFSAVTAAMAQLDLLDPWLQATAAGEGEPAVRFTSCFPFQGDTLFIPPPSNMWPPAAASRLRFKSTRFVPLEMVRALVEEKPLSDDRWIIDPASECLLRADRAAQGGPFRIAVRTSSAVDRVSQGSVEMHSVAVLEFGERAGLWTLAVFRDEMARALWKNSVQAAFRLLADTGFGGERSLGFGHSQTPLFQDCRLPEFVLRQSGESEPESTATEAPQSGWWLLSLFSPGAGDAIDWNGGSYSVVTRGGRIESRAQWGGEKRLVRMIAEGSVLRAPEPPVGAAPNVAPENFPHPVFRSGHAVSISIPWRVNL